MEQEIGLSHVLRCSHGVLAHLGLRRGTEEEAKWAAISKLGERRWKTPTQAGQQTRNGRIRERLIRLSVEGPSKTVNSARFQAAAKGM